MQAIVYTLPPSCVIFSCHVLWMSSYIPFGLSVCERDTEMTAAAAECKKKDEQGQHRHTNRHKKNVTRVDENTIIRWFGGGDAPRQQPEDSYASAREKSFVGNRHFQQVRSVWRRACPEICATVCQECVDCIISALGAQMRKTGRGAVRCNNFLGACPDTPEMCVNTLALACRRWWPADWWDLTDCCVVCANSFRRTGVFRCRRLFAKCLNVRWSSSKCARCYLLFRALWCTQQANNLWKLILFSGGRVRGWMRRKGARSSESGTR